ncbi:hypothetical protein QJS10_CPA10g01495 [Acorus calamus]|uniref:Uncharacterized protein n=1 Tax=Acorus calamus TaxID=4465 RepID=A0AAV9E0K6_ACOCL|nr:hypothetical protein QJS10_CPA10g01495 [Acorus calamus]
MEGMKLKTFVVLVLLATQFFGYSEGRGKERADVLKEFVLAQPAPMAEPFPQKNE